MKYINKKKTFVSKRIIIQLAVRRLCLSSAECSPSSTLHRHVSIFFNAARSLRLNKIIPLSTFCDPLVLIPCVSYNCVILFGRLSKLIMYCKRKRYLRYLDLLPLKQRPPPPPPPFFFYDSHTYAL